MRLKSIEHLARPGLEFSHMTPQDLSLSITWYWVSTLGTLMGLAQGLQGPCFGGGA